MGTNATDVGAERKLAELADEVFRLQRAARDVNPKQANGAEREPDGEKPQATRRAPEGRESGPGELWTDELALAPLVDKIAYGFARGLVVALKELENHIASETRKVGDTVGRRLDTLQASFQDLTEAVSEQRSLNLSVQNKCQDLAAVTTSLQESEARQDAELASLRNETSNLSTSVSERIDVIAASLREADARETSELAAIRAETSQFASSLSDRVEGLSKEVAVQQEDIGAMKSTLCGFSSRMDGLVERLDRQAEAVRSMYATYAQRETELEQLVEGLARLRAMPAAAPAARL